MAGDITVIEHDGIVGASRETPDEMRAAMSAPETVEPETPPLTPPADPPPTDEAPDAPKDAATTPERDEQGKFTKPPVAPAQKKKESIQAEIDRLTYTRREEERRLERIRTERERVEAQPPTKPADKTPAPTGNTFKAFVNDYAAAHPDATYEDAIDAYQVIRETAILDRFKTQTQQDRETNELTERTRAHVERSEALRAITPDFDAANAAANRYLSERGIGDFPPAMKRAILLSDQSERIVRDLSLHPEIAYQRALEASELPATPAAVNLMRTVLESRLSNGSSPAPRSGPGEAPRQSQAKAPPKPVGATPSASSESGEETYEQSQERVRRILHPNRK